MWLHASYTREAREGAKVIFLPPRSRAEVPQATSEENFRPGGKIPAGFAQAWGAKQREGCQFAKAVYAKHAKAHGFAQAWGAKQREGCKFAKAIYAKHAKARVFAQA